MYTETPRVSGMPIEQLLKEFKAAEEDRNVMKGAYAYTLTPTRIRTCTRTGALARA